MNIDRFKHIWKLFTMMYTCKSYGHVFYHGASIDSKLWWVNTAAGKLGFKHVSKQEIRETLTIACEKGWATRYYRYTDGKEIFPLSRKLPKLLKPENWYRLPSVYIFGKGC